MLLGPHKKVQQWIENTRNATSPHFDEVHRVLVKVKEILQNRRLKAAKNEGGSDMKKALPSRMNKTSITQWRLKQEKTQNIYDFTVKDAKGNDVDLSIYKGKVLLIVNVASKCGMTNSNYTELNQLYEKYKGQGLEILAFPCNQFGDEEPGSNDEISEFVCTRFRSEFPIVDKYCKLGKWGIFGDDIQWNFAKFLVDKDGQVVHRYYPTTSPLSLEYDIRKLLK
ncbi:putative phospholipid hydroperoxide glutathione peroxidase [Hibiscus syriacus]|uniref:Glutathione peroxidase n=1 Tax=Hibiscus syriacus TaxID=106335 RepID=A0A6A2XUI4_HIBSY|nr:putative phospholipid hydroperoxide glutathione peroxidase [Hibiscus syriacus]